MFNIIFCGESHKHKLLRSSRWGLEKSELPWEQIFLAIRVFLVKLLAYQVQWPALQIGQDLFIASEPAEGRREAGEAAAL